MTDETVDHEQARSLPTPEASQDEAQGLAVSQAATERTQTGMTDGPVDHVQV